MFINNDIYKFSDVESSKYFLQKISSKKDLVTEYINSTSLALDIGKYGNSVRQAIKRMKRSSIIKTNFVAQIKSKEKNGEEVEKKV